MACLVGSWFLSLSVALVVQMQGAGHGPPETAQHQVHTGPDSSGSFSCSSLHF